MKQTPLNLNIPKPCSENWDKMTPTAPNERYCGKCSKNLIDFTSFSDAEVHRQLASNNGRICGRFRPDQLGRDIHATQPQASRWKHWAAAAAVIASGGLAGQSAPPAPEPAPVEWDAGIINGRVHVVQEPEQATEPKTVTGTVTDESGDPLIGASVSCIVGDNVIVGAVADIDGRFSIPYVENGRLKVEYTGLRQKMIDYIHYKPNKKGQIEVKAVLQQFIEIMGEIIPYDRSLFEQEAPKTTDLKDIEVSVHIKDTEQQAPLPKVAPTSYLQTAEVTPNPFTDRLRIKLQSDQEQQLTAQLFTADGSLVQEWRPRPVHTYPTELQLLLTNKRRLASGQYFLVLQDGAGRMETRVVVRK